MRRSNARTVVRVSLYAVTLFVTGIAACGREPPESVQLADELDTLEPPDSVGALARLIESRHRSFARVSEEKDTLLHTLQTAMLLFSELSDLEREIVGLETRREVAFEPWDERVRRQLERLQKRYTDLTDDLARTDERLRGIEARDALNRAALDDAKRTVAELREDNERRRARIDELVARAAALTRERDAAAARSVARADTIRTLVDERHVVYWVAGTEDELKQRGVIESVGGRHLLFTRVGETLAASRTLDVADFERADRRTTTVIDLPDDAEYEIVTGQDPRYADARTLRQAGDRWRVRDELGITDPRFWEPTRYLILVRR